MAIMERTAMGRMGMEKIEMVKQEMKRITNDFY